MSVTSQRVPSCIPSENEDVIRFSILLASFLRKSDSENFVSTYDKLPPHLSNEKVSSIKEYSRTLAELNDNEFSELLVIHEALLSPSMCSPSNETNMNQITETGQHYDEAFVVMNTSDNEETDSPRSCLSDGADNTGGVPPQCYDESHPVISDLSSDDVDIDDHVQINKHNNYIDDEDDDDRLSSAADLDLGVSGRPKELQTSISSSAAAAASSANKPDDRISFSLLDRSSSSNRCQRGVSTCSITDCSPAAVPVNRQSPTLSPSLSPALAASKTVAQKPPGSLACSSGFSPGEHQPLLSTSAAVGASSAAAAASALGGTKEKDFGGVPAGAEVKKLPGYDPIPMSSSGKKYGSTGSTENSSSGDGTSPEQVTIDMPEEEEEDEDSGYDYEFPSASSRRRQPPLAPEGGSSTTYSDRSISSNSTLVGGAAGGSAGEAGSFNGAATDDDDDVEVEEDDEEEEDTKGCGDVEMTRLDSRQQKAFEESDRKLKNRHERYPQAMPCSPNDSDSSGDFPDCRRPLGPGSRHQNHLHHHQRQNEAAAGSSRPAPRDSLSPSSKRRHSEGTPPPVVPSSAAPLSVGEVEDSPTTFRSVSRVVKGQNNPSTASLEELGAQPRLIMPGTAGQMVFSGQGGLPFFHDPIRQPLISVRPDASDLEKKKSRRQNRQKRREKDTCLAKNIPGNRGDKPVDELLMWLETGGGAVAAAGGPKKAHQQPQAQPQRGGGVKSSQAGAVATSTVGSGGGAVVTRLAAQTTRRSASPAETASAWALTRPSSEPVLLQAAVSNDVAAFVVENEHHRKKATHTIATSSSSPLSSSPPPTTSPDPVSGVGQPGRVITNSNNNAERLGSTTAGSTRKLPLPVSASSPPLSAASVGHVFDASSGGVSGSGTQSLSSSPPAEFQLVTRPSRRNKSKKKQQQQQQQQQQLQQTQHQQHEQSYYGYNSAALSHTKPPYSAGQIRSGHTPPPFTYQRGGGGSGGGHGTSGTNAALNTSFTGTATTTTTGGTDDESCGSVCSLPPCPRRQDNDDDPLLLQTPGVVKATAVGCSPSPSSSTSERRNSTGQMPDETKPMRVNGTTTGSDSGAAGVCSPNTCVSPQSPAPPPAPQLSSSSAAAAGDVVASPPSSSPSSSVAAAGAGDASQVISMHEKLGLKQSYAMMAASGHVTLSATQQQQQQKTQQKTFLLQQCQNAALLSSPPPPPPGVGHHPPAEVDDELVASSQGFSMSPTAVAASALARQQQQSSPADPPVAFFSYASSAVEPQQHQYRHHQLNFVSPAAAALSSASPSAQQPKPASQFLSDSSVLPSVSSPPPHSPHPPRRPGPPRTSCSTVSSRPNICSETSPPSPVNTCTNLTSSTAAATSSNSSSITTATTTSAAPAAVVFVTGQGDTAALVHDPSVDISFGFGFTPDGDFVDTTDAADAAVVRKSEPAAAGGMDSSIDNVTTNLPKPDVPVASYGDRLKTAVTSPEQLRHSLAAADTYALTSSAAAAGRNVSIKVACSPHTGEEALRLRQAISTTGCDKSVDSTRQLNDDFLEYDSETIIAANNYGLTDAGDNTAPVQSDDLHFCFSSSSSATAASASSAGLASRVVFSTSATTAAAAKHGALSSCYSQDSSSSSLLPMVSKEAQNSVPHLRPVTGCLEPVLTTNGTSPPAGCYAASTSSDAAVAALAESESPVSAPRRDPFTLAAVGYLSREWCKVLKEYSNEQNQSGESKLEVRGLVRQLAAQRS